MKALFDVVKANEKVQVCLATHNQSSIETALQTMHHLKLDRRHPAVSFAQLYGMKDYLTYTLGHHGYRSTKLLVFGDVHHVIPYLIRRAQENAAVLGGSEQDIEAIRTVLKMRMQRWISSW